MEKWLVRNVKADYKFYSDALKVDEVIVKLLLNRGIKDLNEAREFINPSMENLNPPYLLKDLDKSVEIMRYSIENKEKILIVGDYDVDGVISTYILYRTLKDVGANVGYHIPHRITEGYGINIDIINRAKEEKVDLIITCDNGIAAIEQINHGKKLGMKVIVTDHHDIPFVENDMGRKLVYPKADAIVNPKRDDCNYPFKKLCGAGVAFKFCQFLYEVLGYKEDKWKELLEFVAIATVCDVVDLTGENRTIVAKGLEGINKSTNYGLNALKNVTSLEDKEIGAYHLGFVIGPCINATGRLETAELSLKLLLSDSHEEAMLYANKLHDLNKERQDMTSLGVEKAIEQVEKEFKEEKVLLLYLPDIHESIAGIIAGRIREKYNSPTFVITNAHDGAKGSGRSIEEYNMFEEMLKCKDIMDKFGGHPMAAGMSLKIENIDKLRMGLNEVCKLSKEDMVPKITIDMALRPEEVSLDLAKNIEILEPFGKSNSKPLFGAKKVKILGLSLMGKNKNFLKLKLKYGENFIDGVMFNKVEEFKGDIENKHGSSSFEQLLNGNLTIEFDIVFNLDVNRFNNRECLQFVIKSFRL
ncbi:single-stranded-DNA-specific exonuclease RecJ [Clostridium frigidicarnis]|uniref:Single-stranded-DNA-specific exonuclease RecJ n=1 Tax=Clostridium frigidicarnis TaxID=84698 RepID=A0A1I0ZFV0_9CLOT|nr:single-stranded-DNA-specific exonuclease RecJ [Clostridium frigidicarnis]SFB23063.1 exonuclease RecJ [Clostridium frigidicarnis]